MAGAEREYTLRISTAERETGLAKEVLRKWESRYGFPEPFRLANGERRYSLDQVQRLRLIKRLIDAGFRPSTIVGKGARELDELAKNIHVQSNTDDLSEFVPVVLRLLQDNDGRALRQRLNELLLKDGISNFVFETIAPLTIAVGEYWAQGQIRVYQEHLYAATVESVLGAAIDVLTNTQSHPRVLLTTLAPEQHRLGNLMLSALLSAEGAFCNCLGTQTPREEIFEAVQHHEMDIVALSFSISFPVRQIPNALRAVRAGLNESVELWAGGAGTVRMKGAPRDVKLCATLDDGLTALNDWRNQGEPANL